MTDLRSASDPLAEPGGGARLRVRGFGLLAGLVTAGLLLAAQGALRQPLFDTFHRYAPAPAASPRIQIVAVDAASLAALGGWPWSRYTLARLTEQIASRGAVAIGYDFLFPEADRQSPEDFARLYPELSPAAAAEIKTLPSMDAVFARVIGRAPVVLARAGVQASSFDAPSPEKIPIAGDVRFEGPVAGAIPRYAGVVSNLEILDGAALGHGLVNGPPDGDGVTRRVPLLGIADGVLTPAFALELVRVAEGGETVRLQGERPGLAAIRIGDHRVPVDPGGRAELRLAVAPAANPSEDRSPYRIHSAVDLLRQGGDPDVFKDSIVLVGLTAAGTSDVVTTPRDSETYGVFVQAQAVDAILRSAALRAPSWGPALSWGVGLALVILALASVPHMRMSLAAICAPLAVATALGGCWLAFQNNLLIDPFPMLAPGTVTAAVMIALLFVEGRRMQARLRTALADERVTAAKISTELAVAAGIQSGMLTPRADLARLSATVDLDAVLLPARSVGGDLYDAFALDDDRLCFLVGDVTGKGVPASLFMALSKALARSLLMRPQVSLDAAIGDINAELSRDNGQAMALSLLVGIVHANGRLDLCCAGHENPLVIDETAQIREIRLRGGPPLCVVDDFPYAVETHSLEPGEILLAFTDGLTEAQAPDGTIYSREQLLAAIRDASGARPLTSMVDRIVASVRAFEAGAEPGDDLTVMALRLRQPKIT